MEKIENAIITSADLSMEDHGVLCLYLGVEGNGWACGIGGYVLGKGYLDAKEFSGTAKGIEEIMRVMDVVGVSKFSQLEGKYIRVAHDGWGRGIKKFGNIVKDKWLDYDEFYANEIRSAKNG